MFIRCSKGIISTWTLHFPPFTFVKIMFLWNNVLGCIFVWLYLIHMQFEPRF